MDKSRLKLVIVLAVLGLAMLGVSYAFVPLYNMFCSALGIPQAKISTQTEILQDYDVDPNRVISIRFTGLADKSMPVEFVRKAPRMDIAIGQPALTAYIAKNPLKTDVQGIAIHQALGFGARGERDVLEFIDLIECFCFDEFTYPAGKEVTLPLSFTIRPDLPKEIHTITFSYTLYPVK